jgi:hypothetical protein
MALAVTVNMTLHKANSGFWQGRRLKPVTASDDTANHDAGGNLPSPKPMKHAFLPCVRRVKR